MPAKCGNCGGKHPATMAKCSKQREAREEWRKRWSGAQNREISADIQDSQEQQAPVDTQTLQAIVSASPPEERQSQEEEGEDTEMGQGDVEMSQEGAEIGQEDVEIGDDNPSTVVLGSETEYSEEECY
jgi:hypothetical protein